MLKTLTESFFIYSYQTDANARLRPGALLEIMQEMAGAHAEKLGIGRDMLLAQNLVWVLTRLEVHMTRWPTHAETLTVETFPIPNRRFFFPRYFVFRDAQGQQIGYAGSLWVLLDVKERKMVRPDAIAPYIPDNSDLTAPMGLPAPVSECPADPITGLHEPLYTDLDMNGHVNNTRYLDWCCNALGIETLRTHELRTFAVNFNMEVRPGQSVRTELRRDGDHFSFSGFVNEARHFDVGGVLAPIG
ncbi:MAG: hypothetical protein IJE07_00880 [Clostridia bacterium]|nr:hypothetical protein [Clostridia bacterium]